MGARASEREHTTGNFVEGGGGVRMGRERARERESSGGGDVLTRCGAVCGSSLMVVGVWD